MEYKIQIDDKNRVVAVSQSDEFEGIIINTNIANFMFEFSKYIYQNGELIYSLSEDYENTIILNQLSTRIEENKDYLAETDWISAKINDAIILGEDTTNLINKYKDTLIKRKQVREEINNLQNQLTNVK